MTSVAVFFLGGTIAMSAPDPGLRDGGGAVVQLSGADLLALPEVTALGLTLTAVDFRAVGSSRLTVDDLADLHRAADQSIAAGAQGIVIVQGTDTLEESAHLLDLWWPHPEPIVVTGAMRNPDLPGAEGPANLLAALRVAASTDARGLGVLVVLHDEIHAARFVAKRHTSSLSAFTSPATGPLGRVDEGRVRLLTRVDRMPPLGLPVRPVSVPLLVTVLDDDGLLFRAVQQADGVVIAAFGVGHLRPEIADLAAELAQRVPVVLASRTGAGPVHRDTYGGPGSEADLIARGLLPAGMLDAYKARLLLIALLAGGLEPDQVRERFLAQVGEPSNSLGGGR